MFLPASKVRAEYVEALQVYYSICITMCKFSFLLYDMTYRDVLYHCQAWRCRTTWREYVVESGNDHCVVKILSISFKHRIKTFTLFNSESISGRWWNLHDLDDSFHRTSHAKLIFFLLRFWGRSYRFLGCLGLPEIRWSDSVKLTLRTPDWYRNPHSSTSHDIDDGLVWRFNGTSRSWLFHLSFSSFHSLCDKTWMIAAIVKLRPVKSNDQLPWRHQGC